jgi:hypothetical protein
MIFMEKNGFAGAAAHNHRWYPNLHLTFSYQNSGFGC